MTTRISLAFLTLLAACASGEVDGRDSGTVMGTVRLYWDGSTQEKPDAQKTRRFVSGLEVSGDFSGGSFDTDSAVERPDYSLLQAAVAWRGGLSDEQFFVHGIVGLAYSNIDIEFDSAPNLNADESDAGLGLGFHIGVTPLTWLTPYVRGVAYGGIESTSGQFEIGVELAPVPAATVVLAYRYWEYEVHEFDFGLPVGRDVDLEIDGLLLGLAARF